MFLSEISENTLITTKLFSLFKFIIEYYYKVINFMNNKKTGTLGTYFCPKIYGKKLKNTLFNVNIL